MAHVSVAGLADGLGLAGWLSGLGWDHSYSWGQWEGQLDGLIWVGLFFGSMASQSLQSCSMVAGVLSMRRKMQGAS